MDALRRATLSNLLIRKADERRSLGDLIDDFIVRVGRLAGKSVEDLGAELLVQAEELVGKGLATKAVAYKVLVERLENFQVHIDTKGLNDLYARMVKDSGSAIPGFKFRFGETDVETIASMRKQFYWMGSHHHDGLQEKLKGVLERAFDGRVPKVELPSVMQQEFEGIINNTTRYFQGVADHIITQNQNIIRVKQAEEYGYSYMRVFARLDDRTSPVCRSMHGRLIPVRAMAKQVRELESAKDVGERVAAAKWTNDPILGKKLPKGIGLPPYHFRCRTEALPAYIYSDEVDGKKVKYSTYPPGSEATMNGKKKKVEFSHIDATGVERVVTEDTFSHRGSKKEKTTKAGAIGALNSLQRVAPHHENPERFSAWSGNGHYTVFQGGEVWTVFKPTEKLNYYKRKSLLNKEERVK